MFKRKEKEDINNKLISEENILMRNLVGEIKDVLLDIYNQSENDMVGIGYRITLIKPPTCSELNIDTDRYEKNVARLREYLDKLKESEERLNLLKNSPSNK